MAMRQPNCQRCPASAMRARKGMRMSEGLRALIFCGLMIVMIAVVVRWQP
jgi:hypothetical protein